MSRQKYPSCGYRQCAYYKRWRDGKKPLNKADKYLILSIVTLLIFSVTAVVLNALDIKIQEQLIISIYAFFGTEIGACCVIKVINIKAENQAVQPYTEAYEYENYVDGDTD